jgi:hypothetical protein
MNATDTIDAARIDLLLGAARHQADLDRSGADR